MSYSIRFDRITGIAYVVLQGPTDAGGMEAVLQELAVDGEFAASKRLWDVREATGDLTSSDIERLARAALSQDGSNRAMVAIVASDNFVFGMSRVFEVYRQSDNVRVEVFRDIEAAERWLAEEATRS